MSGYADFIKQKSQLDVIERCIVMWGNPGDVVMTPFMGVGSEVYGAIINGRKGVGVELKPSYFKQAKRNIEAAKFGIMETEKSDDLLTFADEMEGAE